ncbi:hypothetical protein DQT76_21885 [Salmonella enterica subsp. diarizonae]|nr:hypothetical protein [Salmonella enterica subsp. diarizonae]EKN5804275.1 hypothetical protein [Salmonella enterica subsp. enterica]
MKNITQLVFKPKKSAAAKGVARQGTIWLDNDDPDEIDALSTLAIKDAGFKRSDFFKFAGIRGFARTFTVRGMRTKGRDNGEKLHKSEKG